MQEESTPRTREELANAIEGGVLREIEVAWPDHQGHPRGKRVPARGFLRRAEGSGFPFCDAALAWDMTGDVLDGMRLTGWDTGYGDMIARPDLSTFRWLPWRPGAGMVISDLVDHHGELIRTAPRTVLQRAVDRIAALGYTAEVGVELEFYLLDSEGGYLADGVQCYSLQKANEMDPAFGGMFAGPVGVLRLRGGQRRVRPGPVRGQPAPRPADGGRRPGDALQVRRQGARAPRRRDRDVHGQAVQRHLGLLDAPPRVAVEGRRARLRARRGRRERPAPRGDRRHHAPPPGHRPVRRRRR